MKFMMAMATPPHCENGQALALMASASTDTMVSMCDFSMT
jgi:hypothetical protein